MLNFTNFNHNDISYYSTIGNRSLNFICLNALNVKGKPPSRDIYPCMLL
jgi:hypothetical protein